MYIRVGAFLLVVLWLIYVFSPPRKKDKISKDKILNAYLRFIDEKLAKYQRITNVHKNIAFTDSSYYEVRLNLKTGEGTFLHKKSKNNKTTKINYNKKLNKIEEE